ncbi:MAG TPA: tetratricopeptide repeat protein [Deltaproteobacteria bacterium]|nr:tetratricopeptide repeat protein [Deltaproteobacteria bacterium]
MEEKTKPEEDRLFFLSEAEILLQQNKLPEALNLARERLRRFPFDVDARVIAAKVFIGMDNATEAQNILREVEDIISGLSTLYMRMGDIYLESGLHRDAKICYEKFIWLNPNSDKAKEIIENIVFLEQQEPLLAETEEDDDYYGSHKPEFGTITMADLYIRQGHFSMAAEILQNILQDDPDNDLAKAKLEAVSTAMSLQSRAKNRPVENRDNVAAALTRWLENINRLKNDETEK